MTRCEGIVPVGETRVPENQRNKNITLKENESQSERKKEVINEWMDG